MRRDELMQKTISVHEAVRELKHVMNDIDGGYVNIEEVCDAFIEKLGNYIETRERCQLEDFGWGKRL